MRHVVLDTNALIQALPTRSIYHKIWSEFLAGTYCLCVSNEILTEWRQRYDDNRRANKRVSVKSDVVGRSTSGRLLPTGRKNHLYQTARDWTWARLIEDGKALLAIDPEIGRAHV